MTTHDIDETGRTDPGTLAAVASAALLAVRVAAAVRDGRNAARGGEPPDASRKQIFGPHERWTDRQRRTYAAFEIAYTAVDFAAASCFVTGSTLFFWQELHTPATWMFLSGSLLFALKPTLRLCREIVHVSMGRTDEVAKRMSD